MAAEAENDGELKAHVLSSSSEVLAVLLLVKPPTVHHRMILPDTISLRNLFGEFPWETVQLDVQCRH
ncbi:hypothetical protein OWV82_005046 [Melia azedarach]|uniref:Uncharacterized protein n=1 Tax=Melia azedarach TaxID=155640 RepID=A0ACC1YTE4_MELAZ|nr:hypothetical protein OWV82_005046 [Melia azedarach]